MRKRARLGWDSRLAKRAGVEFTIPTCKETLRGGALASSVHFIISFSISRRRDRNVCKTIVSQNELRENYIKKKERGGSIAIKKLETLKHLGIKATYIKHTITVCNNVNAIVDSVSLVPGVFPVRSE